MNELLNFDHLHAYREAFPTQKNDSLIGSQADYDALPETFQDQLAFFSHPAVAEFLYAYLHHAQLMTGPVWNPFQAGNFKQVQSYALDEDEAALKKWLYHRGLPFSKEVYVLPNYQHAPMLMTWKMVIKLCTTLFQGDDRAIFDASAQWCLFYWHEGTFFHGQLNVADPAPGYAAMEQMIERKRRFPGFQLPY